MSQEDGKLRQRALVYYVSATSAVKCILFTAVHRTHSYAQPPTGYSSLIKAVSAHLSKMAHLCASYLPAVAPSQVFLLRRRVAGRKMCHRSQVRRQRAASVRWGCMLAAKRTEVRCERYEVTRLRRAHKFSANMSASLQVPILLGQVVVTLP